MKFEHLFARVVFKSICNLIVLAILNFAKCPESILAQSSETKTASYVPQVASLDIATIKFEWHDHQRNRNVPVKIYYPKSNLDPSPIILFSHGLGGSRENYEYLGQHWAGCGYVSAHMQHIGSDESVWIDLPLAQRAKALQKSAANLANAIDRPTDCQFVIDQLELLNKDHTLPLANRLQVQSIAVAGHSFGGYTAMALAGQSFRSLLGTRRVDESRIKAAMQMSAPVPAVRRNLDSTYNSIVIPVMHWTGTKDFVEILPQTTAEDRRIPFDHMNRAETCLVIFNDGDHMVFSGRDRALANLDKLAQDALFQKLICSGTTAFWDAYLKENQQAKKWLIEGGFRDLLGKHATFETKSPKSIPHHSPSKP